MSKLITAPSARNTSLNDKDVVPRVAPSFESGTKEVSAVNVLVLIPETPLSIAPKPAAIVPLVKSPVVCMAKPSISDLF